MNENTRDYVAFSLNGQWTEVRGDDAFLNLSDFLRKRKSLTGSKIVCAEGDCGACSVLRAFAKPRSAGKPRFDVINSCIARVAQLDASFIVTVEGIADGKQLDPIQKSMVECNASQCGFCTPGFVMALCEHFEDRLQESSSQKIKNALTGNLCRCTGYQAIIDAALRVKRDKKFVLRDRYIDETMLAKLERLSLSGVRINGRRETFLAPCDREQLSRVRLEFATGTILAAGTDLGVQKNKHGKKTAVLISLHLIEELYRIQMQRGSVDIGARVTLSELRKALKPVNAEMSRFLNIFASPQIKNFGTLVGNIANASPIADTPPWLLSLDARLHLWNPETKQVRELRIDEFYLGYKKLNLLPGEIIFRVSFDLPLPDDRLYLKKVSQRRDLDISTVNAAFFRSAESRNFRLAVGGVAAVPLRLKKTETYLSQNQLNSKNINAALDVANEEVKPLSDLRGTEAYRRLVLRNLLRDFLSSMSENVIDA